MRIFWLIFFLPTLIYGEMIPVLSKGRIRPLHIHAEQWLYDTYGDDSLPSGLSAEELLWQLTLQGHEAWDEFPLFHLSSNVKRELQLEANHASYNDLSSLITHVPKPSADLQQLIVRLTEYQKFSEINADPNLSIAKSAYGMNALPSRHDLGKWLPLNTLAIAKQNLTAYSDETWDEISNLYQQLRISFNPDLLAEMTSRLNSGYETIEGKPYRLGTHSQLYLPSKMQLAAESLYYRYPWIPFTILLYGTALLFFLWKPRFALCFLIAAFLLHTAILGLRCYILGRPPVSNMFETIAYVPWIAVLLGMALRQKGTMMASSGVALLLLSLMTLTYPRHELENVQAVLNSHYWLIIHVLMVVGSYGAFILSGLIAHYALIKRFWTSTERETKWILSTLYIGVVLLIGGTILGGVWANQSWGRFWDWDPKESWAFISSCFYLIVIHAYRFSKIGSMGLAIGSIAGLQAITFTWYGVNYILGVGLHSYGFGQGGEIIYALFVGLELIFVGSMAIFHKKIDINTL